MGYNIQQPAIPNADDKWTAAEHVGNLLIFFPTEVRRGIKTSNGDSDAVACARVVNLDTGRVLHNTLIFGTALVPNIGGGAPDGIVLGRLGQGEGKPGQSKPWILQPHDEADLQRCHAWLAQDAQGNVGQPQAQPGPAPVAQGGWGAPAPAASPAPATGGWGSPPAPAPQAAGQGGWGSPTPAATAPAQGGWGAPAPAPAPDPTGQALFDAFKRKGVDPMQFQSEEQAKQAWQYVKNNPDVA